METTTTTTEYGNYEPNPVGDFTFDFAMSLGTLARFYFYAFLVILIWATFGKAIRLGVYWLIARIKKDDPKNIDYSNETVAELVIRAEELFDKYEEFKTSPDAGPAYWRPHFYSDDVMMVTDFTAKRERFEQLFDKHHDTIAADLDRLAPYELSLALTEAREAWNATLEQMEVHDAMLRAR